MTIRCDTDLLELHTRPHGRKPARMTPPTFTDAELLRLSQQLGRLRDELVRAPDFGEATANGYLIEMDDAALSAAALVVDRLYRWRKWPSIAPESYLPAPKLTAVPQSLRVQS